MALHTILLVVACVVFGLRVLAVESKVDLLALGLFIWSLSWFV